VLRRRGGLGHRLERLSLAAEAVKIGFLVKQAEEPWFQTEWAFAEKAGKELVSP
jgi:L-arabinose transport system substrate-binding protein